MGNLIRALPPEAAFRHALDPIGSAWSTTEHLLASLLEVTDSHRLNFVTAHSKGGTPIPKPIRVPRPGASKATTKRQSTPQEVKRFMAALGR